jgi:hypothetical protein
MVIFEVWAQLYLSKQSTEIVNDFFSSIPEIKQKCIIQNPHLTVYHARRPIPNLLPSVEKTNIILLTKDTRFMVFVPGGENKKVQIIPKKHKVGIRVQKISSCMVSITNYRNRLLAFETKIVLGKRKPSTIHRNAFGSKYYQPHIAFLRSGNGINNDLSPIGKLFREKIPELYFDQFTIEIV